VGSRIRAGDRADTHPRFVVWDIPIGPKGKMRRQKRGKNIPLSNLQDPAEIRGRQSGLVREKGRCDQGRTPPLQIMQPLIKGEIKNECA
jgi:hypothetical protein